MCARNLGLEPEIDTKQELMMNRAFLGALLHACVRGMRL